LIHEKVVGAIGVNYRRNTMATVSIASNEGKLDSVSGVFAGLACSRIVQSMNKELPARRCRLRKAITKEANYEHRFHL
jgi:hypothetical protein